MQIPSPYESMILKCDEKAYFNIQFSSRQTLRIHSSQQMQNPLQRFKISVTPYKGPPPRSNSSFRPGILTQQRQTRKSQPSNIFEGLVTNISRNPTKKTDTLMSYNLNTVSQNQSSLATRMTSLNDEKSRIFRIPIRTTKTDTEPVKVGSLTDRPSQTAVPKETPRIMKIHRRRISNPLNEGINDGRYKNIKFIKNDRSKSQCDIHHSLTSTDVLIPSTDNRHQVIESVMREYSLDFIPENSKYIICQNPQSQNYSVTFTEKSVPTCKECHIPICINLSYTSGFSIICKSGYCSKQTLYSSNLSPQVIQELWDYNTLTTPDIPPIEKQGISKLIQNGIYKHRDITRTLSNFSSCVKSRPTTSMSPSRRNQSQTQRKENEYSSQSTVYLTRFAGTQKGELDWRKHNESVRDTKEYFNLKSSFSRNRSPAKMESYSISRNESVRDQRNEEKEVGSKEDVDDPRFEKMPEMMK